MLEMVLYAIGFFVITMLIQYLLSKRSHSKKHSIEFWTGSSAIIAICVLGIINNSTFPPIKPVELLEISSK